MVSGSGGGLATTGSVTLGGANTFSGTTAPLGGALLLNNSLALQDSTLNYSAGTLTFGAGVTSATIGALSGSQNLSMVNTVGAPAAVSLSLGGNNSTQNYSGVLSDGGNGAALTKTGTGTQTLSGVNTFTGGITINSPGTLSIGGSGQLGGAIMRPASPILASSTTTAARRRRFPGA